MYRGGQNFETVKANFDKNSAEETINKQNKHIEFLNQENTKLEGELQEIKELLGICESKDPTDKDRVHLKTLVRKLKQQNDVLKNESKVMERTIGDLKGGRYNMAEGGREFSNEELNRLKSQLSEVDQRNTDLTKENHKLRQDLERISQSQSAT